MRVLVCGGAGYIGSFVVKALLKMDYELAVVDNLSANPHPLPPGVKLIQIDYGDDKIADLTPEFDCFFIFSGKISVSESMSNPWLYWSENVFKLANFLEHVPVGAKIVFSSSAAVYRPQEDPLTEDSECLPSSVYGVTKLAAESVIKNFPHKRFSAVCLRYFNAAGGEPDGSVAENHSPETHFIPRLCLHYKGLIDDFKIFGNDYPTKDGSCIRDFVHVLDLAEAHVKALEFISSRETFEVINLGNGKGYSLFEVVREFEKIIGEKLPVEISSKRPGDPPFLVADITKAQKLLNWYPKFKLADILQSQLAWTLKNC